MEEGTNGTAHSPANAAAETYRASERSALLTCHVRDDVSWQSLSDARASSPSGTPRQIPLLLDCTWPG